MKKLVPIALATCLVCALALVLAVNAGAPNKPKPKTCKTHPHMARCKPPVTPPPPPASQPDCDHSVMAGKDGEEGNDDCARTPAAPPAVPPVSPPPSSPPPVALKCDEGLTLISRSATQVVCAKVIVKTRTKTKIKRVKQRPKIEIKRYCPPNLPPHPPTG